MARRPNKKQPPQRQAARKASVASEEPRETRRQREERVDHSIQEFERQFMSQSQRETALEAEIAGLKEQINHMKESNMATATPETEKDTTKKGKKDDAEAKGTPGSGTTNQSSTEQNRQDRDDIKGDAKDAGKKAGNIFTRTYKRIGPTTKKEFGLTVVSYAVGFVSGGRVATSDFLTRQMENTGS